MSESETWLLGNVVEEVVARGDVGIIIAKLLSTALADSALDCVGVVRLQSLEAVSLDRSGVLRVVFEVLIVVGILVVVGSIKSSSISSATSPVDCVSGFCSWKVKAMAGGSAIIVVAVVLVFAVDIVIVGIVGIGSISRKSSSASSAMSAVDCISGCGSLRLEAMVGVSPILVFLVVVVIAVVSIIVGIIVVGIGIRKLSSASSATSAVVVVNCGVA